MSKTTVKCGICGQAGFGTLKELAAHFAREHGAPMDGPSTAPAEFQRTDTERLDYMAGLVRVTWCCADSQTLHAIVSPNPELRVGDSLRTWIDRQLLMRERTKARRI